MIHAAESLQKTNPNGLQDELIRHIDQDSRMSGFDFGVQLLDTAKMTYWGKHRDAVFWIENASIKWKERQAPFYTLGTADSPIEITPLAGCHRGSGF
jgi:hypothetical protein